MRKTHIFEFLIIDNLGKTEISTVKSLVMALSYPEKLWQKAEIKFSNNEVFIEDKASDIILHASKMPTSYSESVFTLTASSKNVQSISTLRERLIVHLIQKLGFSNARIINDTISESISLAIYPLITQMENKLRSYIQTALIQSAGLNWWENIASAKTLEKINIRKQYESQLTNIIDNSMTLTDFDDITEIALLTSLATESFKSKWEALSILRKRVLANSIFSYQDLTSAENLCTEILELLPTNIFLKNGISISAPTKPEAPTKITYETRNGYVVPSNKFSEPETPKPKVIVAVPSKDTKSEQPVSSQTIEKDLQKPIIKEKAENRGEVDLISESVLLQELKAVQNQENGFVDLKAFVTKTLGSKGYAFGPTYFMAKTMNEKGMLQIYDTKDHEGEMVKAIRVNS